MYFDSLDFAYFLPIVVVIYWLLQKTKLKVQNGFVLAASYFFYGWWDWRFLSLIAASSLIDYFVGLALDKEEVEGKRKLLLWTSVVVNLGLLGFFKYYDFFLDNFEAAFSFFGSPIQANRLDIVLPVGISFYTFQTLSYTIDIYRKKLKPTKDIIAFGAFVSFFPQLVAGPIERASNLLPQFKTKRTFDHASAVDGLRQLLWGFFKKLVIADNCAHYVNDIFGRYHDINGSALILAAFLFAIQVYADFSGYSDIAIGTARLFGFKLMRNFAYPLFSRDIAELWRRWHISLTTWFRDYLYIPLGGSRGSTFQQIRNVFIVFVVCAFWHGPKWAYITWGVINAFYFLPLLLTKTNRNSLDHAGEGRLLPTFKEAGQMLFTFFLFSMSTVFLWSNDNPDYWNMTRVMRYFERAYSMSFFEIPTVMPNTVIVLVSIMIISEWFQRKKEHALEFSPGKVPTLVRWGIYHVIVLFIIWFGGKPQEFFYFQF